MPYHIIYATLSCKAAAYLAETHPRPMPRSFKSVTKFCKCVEDSTQLLIVIWKKLTVAKCFPYEPLLEENLNSFEKTNNKSKIQRSLLLQGPNRQGSVRLPENHLLSWRRVFSTLLPRDANEDDAPFVQQTMFLAAASSALQQAIAALQWIPPAVRLVYVLASDSPFEETMPSQAARDASLIVFPKTYEKTPRC